VSLPSPTRRVFEQRGNYPVFAVKYDGTNADEVLEFVRSRGGVDSYWQPPDNDNQLVIKRGIYYLTLLSGTWLVDQHLADIEKLSPWRFVFCADERFWHLYKEVTPEEHHRRTQLPKVSIYEALMPRKKKHKWSKRQFDTLRVNVSSHRPTQVFINGVLVD
jgi:hypothetical protein